MAGTRKRRAPRRLVGESAPAGDAVEHTGTAPDADVPEDASAAEAPPGARPKRARKSRAREQRPREDRARHYHVYVVYLRDPRGDGKAGYYVGMTGLSPDERLANHLAGNKAARIVRRNGVRLVPSLYEHLNPMTYEEAVRMEGVLADSLRKRGFQVFGGH